MTKSLLAEDNLVNQLSRLAVLSISLSLAACSVLNEDKVEYQSAGKGPSLEVPLI